MLVKILIGYLCIMSLIGFILMGIDKRKAIRHAWRIPEARLFCVALLGGSLGCLMGMYTFRHKTRHWYFVVGMPVILMIQAAIVGLAVFYRTL